MTVDVVATPWVNHAMAHVGLPFVRRVVVDLSALGGAVREVRVEVTLRDQFGDVLTRPWSRTLADPDPALPWELDDLDIAFEPGAISTIEEETAAELEVAVDLDGTRAATVHRRLPVLAARQWVIDPHAELLSLELLSSFVQPNHQSVAALLPRVAERLLQKTGSGSLGVQGLSPTGIDTVVEAAFAVLHDLSIHYAEPPASWGLGQKVRTPGDVLDGRLGTCLDTTLTLAAVLEQIGIPPVVWIARGHAFLGYWRYLDRGLPNAATTEIAQAANAVDLDLMGVVETTMITRERRPPKDLFERAGNAVRDHWFTGRSHELIAVVDVAMARMLRIHPLPSRRVREDGVVEIVEWSPPARASGAGATVQAAEPGVPAVSAKRADVPPRIQAWKNALLDLSLRNRLLNLGQPMAQVRLVVPQGELGAVGDVLQQGRTLTLRAVEDLNSAVRTTLDRDAHAIPGDVQRDLLEVRSTIFTELQGPSHKAELDRLRFRAQSGRRETGANPLLLSLGRLDWKLGDRDLAAPLVLIPAEIRGLTLPYRIAYDPAGEVTVNRSLLEKLRHEFGFAVPALAEMPRTADGAVDVAEVLRLFRMALDESELGFRVVDEARLTISGFTGYLLWRDLDQHWETFLESPLVRHLVETPTGEYADPGATQDSLPALDEVVAVAPIPADGSQAQAIALARAGRSFVLEGPPGTGKSQTITNILADQMMQGRRVLFVAEKGAALDVVRKRLGHVGLLPFTLDLHDHNASPTTVKAGLKSALAQQPMADADGYRVAGQDVHATAAVLTGYRDRLHEPNRAGLSLWDAHAQHLALGDGPTLPVPEAAVGRADFDAAELRRAVADAVAPLAELGPHGAAAWGFAGVTGAPPAEVLAAVERVDRAQAALPPDLLPAGIATVADLEAVVWLLLEPGLGEDLAVLDSPRWRAALAELQQRTGQVAQRFADLLPQFLPPVLEVDLSPVRQHLREANASFFIGRKGRLLRAAAPVLDHLRPGVEVRPAELPDLVEQIAAVAADQRAVQQSWRALPGLAEIGALALADPGAALEIERLITQRTEAAQRFGRLSPELGAEVRRRRRAGSFGAGVHPSGGEAEPSPFDPPHGSKGEDAVTGRGSGPNDGPIGGLDHGALDGLNDGPTRSPAVDGPLRELVAAWAVLATATDSRADDQARFAGEAGLLAAWRAGRERRTQDSALLARWRRAAAPLEPLTDAVPEARWALLTGSVPAEDAPAGFDRGVAMAALAERWRAAGFDDFHGPSHDRTAERYVRAGQSLRDSLTTVLPAGLIDRRPFRPNAVIGRAAALDRELNRTRGGASVRQLIQTHGAVIAEITPCVLVSPDSLARFVPPGAMEFDLVVFDEASQIRVPDAIGALGRARACVVAGDSKQLPPTQFAQVSVDDDEETVDEFTVVPDEESVLGECVQAGLPRHWLSWHYRSTDEALIAFSNEQYYEGRLSSFPASPADRFDTGVSFTRIDGHFRRSVPKDAGQAEKGLLRTNPTEAAAVVEEVLRRWRRRERSIGVVTFNAPQRNLIHRMLWDSGVEGVAESMVLADDGLFVKNLENVQGDERDVIIFSTAFSANQAGVLPLNFGPLNRAGGERRLNVAVTRARRRVMVFSSFDPEDIRVEQTNSVGVRHLRAYLEVAKYGTPPEVVPSAGALDRHREEIAEALRREGLAVETSVGLSEFRIDLVVTDPARGDRSALAVLLDGPGWARRTTTGDRDGLPDQVLRGIMGWPAVHRVWLPEWLGDRAAALQRVIEALAAVDSRRAIGEAEGESVFLPYEPGGDSPVLDSGEEPDGADDPLNLFNGEDDPDEGPYAEPDFETRPRGRLDKLDWPGQAQAQTIDLMREIVEACGPISVRRLARLVVSVHGISRLTETRLTQIRPIVPDDLRRDTEGFIWPRGRDPLRWEGFRSGGNAKDRPLEDIALRELANAQCHLVRQSVGIADEELHRETTRLFGGTRVTESGRTRLEQALDHAVAERRLKRAGGLVVPA